MYSISVCQTRVKSSTSVALDPNHWLSYAHVPVPICRDAMYYVCRQTKFTKLIIVTKERGSHSAGRSSPVVVPLLSLCSVESVTVTVARDLVMQDLGNDKRRVF